MIEDGYISLRRFLGLIFIIGVGFSAYVIVVVLGQRLSAAAVGEIIGGGIAMSLLPALVTAPWRLIQRRRGKVTNVPVAVAGLIFVAFAYMVLMGAWYEAGL